MPAAAKPGATPLIVVVVPGGRGDRGDRLGVGAAATKQGFAVLYPTSGDTLLGAQSRAGRRRRRRRRGAARPHAGERLHRCEADRRHRRLERRRLRRPPGLRAARPLRRGRPGRRRLPRARPVPGERARLVPRHPRDGRHRRPLQRQEAGSRRVGPALHRALGAPRRLRSQAGADGAAPARHARALPRLRRRAARRAPAPVGHRPRVARRRPAAPAAQSLGRERDSRAAALRGRGAPVVARNDAHAPADGRRGAQCDA